MHRKFRFGIAALVAMLMSAGTAAAEPLGGQRLAGVVEKGEAGYDLAAVGDLDGDGREDFLVGAPFGDAGKGISAGAAYLFYGPLDPKATRLSDADAVFLGGLPGDYSGEDLGAAGDLDGDGLDELFIGAPGSIAAIQPGEAAPGVGYLFHGRRERRSGTVLLEPACLAAKTCDATFTGAHESDFFSFGIPNAPIGDTDGDGKDELVIGSAGFGGFSGAAYLYYGERFAGEYTAAQADATLLGAPGGVTTWPMTGAGDLDGDGLADFALGAPGDLFGTSAVGTVYVYYGAKERRTGVSQVTAADAVLVGGPTGIAGRGLIGGSDVDGDGLDELLVGEPGPWSNSQVPGRVHLIHGSRERLGGQLSLGSVPGQAVIADDRVGAQAGFAVALGDLDGDGLAEVLAGVPKTAEDAGEVAIFRGGAKRREGTVALAGADKLLTGGAEDEAGFSLATGRFDGDGRADLLVGVPAGGANGRGGALLLATAGPATEAPLPPAAKPATPAAPATPRAAPSARLKLVVSCRRARVTGRGIRSVTFRVAGRRSVDRRAPFVRAVRRGGRVRATVTLRGGAVKRLSRRGRCR